MRLVSWNVNGLRACAGKGFYESMAGLDADAVCLQEIKLKPEQFENRMEGYEAVLNSAERPGYSGTAVFTRVKPLSVSLGIGIPEHDTEGRVICAEFESFYLVCCYTPNSKDGLSRLPYRMEWEDAFRAYLMQLDKQKPVVLCGDLNVAHKEIDLKNPDTNHMSAGFTDEERGKMTELLGAGFTDSFRYLHPDAAGAYSWWSYRMRARERNAGWRIDYFIVSDRIKDRIRASEIHAEIQGSDHCPVSLDIDV
ncbi:MAG: exodeoxyribonuclease III [Clostridiales bacterium]|nr:exodeoxyribonuclease III [Clostridiales bacterium]